MHIPAFVNSAYVASGTALKATGAFLSASAIAVANFVANSGIFLAKALISPLQGLGYLVGLTSAPTVTALVVGISLIGAAVLYARNYKQVNATVSEQATNVYNFFANLGKKPDGTQPSTNV